MHKGLLTTECISGGKKCQFFGNVCVRTKWMIPYFRDLNAALEEKTANLISEAESVLVRKTFLDFLKILRKVPNGKFVFVIDTGFNHT